MKAGKTSKESSGPNTGKRPFFESTNAPSSSPETEHTSFFRLSPTDGQNPQSWDPSHLTVAAEHLSAKRDAIQKQESPSEGSAQTLTNSVSSTGLGILNGSYEPGRGQDPGVLTVTLRVHFSYLMSGGAAFTPLRRRAYESNYKSLVERAWSHRYVLHRIDQRRNRTVERANVELNVEVADSRSGADFMLHVANTPRQGWSRDFVFPPSQREVDDITGQHVGPYSSAGQIYDEGLRSVPDYNALVEGEPQVIGGLGTTLYFEENTPEFNIYLSDYGRILNEFRDRLRSQIMQGSSLHPPQIEIVVRGYANSESSLSQPELGYLSLRRAERVREELESRIGNRRVEVIAIPMGGVQDGEARRRNRVEITVRNMRFGHRTAAHEVGHMLGLGDEYIEASRQGQRRGDASRHSALATQLGLDPVLVGDDVNSIMDAGSQVRPHHYVTFAELISRITGTPLSDWRIRN